MQRGSDSDEPRLVKHYFAELHVHILQMPTGDLLLLAYQKKILKC